MPLPSDPQETGLPSFGEKLKLEREKRKITLDQISSTTKIGTRMLQALEDEKFNQLPGGIFNKGFVRAYARTLGLDEDQTIADYLEASGEAPPPRTEPPIRESRDNAHPHIAREAENGRLEIRAELASHQLPWGVFAVILLLIALGLSLWTHRRREQERLARQPQVAQRSESQGSGQTASPLGAAASAQASPVGESNSSTAPVTSTPGDKPASASSQSEGSAVPASPAPGEFVVAIRARDESWLSVMVDDKPSGAETLESGDERTFHGRQRIVVKVGNVGALDFRLNGRQLPVGGDVGEVKTITIGPAGVITAPSAPLFQ
ncbi:MAG: RodZ domain-containing protein [Terriglobales bacterium]